MFNNKKLHFKRPAPKKIPLKKDPTLKKNIIQNSSVKLPYQHFIIIRFSLAFKQGNLQKMSYTLNDNRLEKRFKLFENICLPSLISQNKKENVSVLINITDNMPEKWKNKLHELIDEHKFIKIQEFDHTINVNLRTCLHNKYLKKYIKPETKIIATSRLDDDDALTPNFTDVISKHCNSNYINNIISFPNGYFLNPINKKYSPMNRKLLAIGLTLIQYVNQYQRFPYGIYSQQHSHWGGLTRCIHLDMVSYIRTVHDTNNSTKNGITTRVPGNSRSINLDMLRKQFPGIRI